jgi:hypothetical protein
MLCACCIIPFLLQGFGLVMGYKIHILIFVIQVAFLWLNVFHFKQKKNLIHIIISITVNILMGMLGLTKIYFSEYVSTVLMRVITLMGFINMLIFIYRNFIKKNGKHKCNNHECGDKH